MIIVFIFFFLLRMMATICLFMDPKFYDMFGISSREIYEAMPNIWILIGLKPEIFIKPLAFANNFLSLNSFW